MVMKSFQPSEALSVCFRSVEKRPKDSRVKGFEPSLLLVMPSLKRHQHVFSFSAAVASKSCRYHQTCHTMLRQPPQDWR